MADRKFNDWLKFGEHLRRVKRDLIPRAKELMLNQWGNAVALEARDRIIGRLTPLPATGPFPAWQPLKRVTILRKRRLGLGKFGNPRSMLYASGDLARSITYRVNRGRWQVKVGTDIEYGRAQEYGNPSKNLPPRPYLSTGAIRGTERILDNMGGLLCRTLAGDRPRWI